MIQAAGSSHKIEDWKTVNNVSRDKNLAFFQSVEVAVVATEILS